MIDLEMGFKKKIQGSKRERERERECKSLSTITKHLHQIDEENKTFEWKMCIE